MNRIILGGMGAALTVVACASGVQSVTNESAPRIVGSYSSIQYIPEAGDLLGYEVLIVPCQTGYKAFLQVAEGGIEAFLVDVTTHADSVSFVVPLAHLAGRFAGRVTATALEGTFTYPGGDPEHVLMQRGISYWIR